MKNRKLVFQTIITLIFVIIILYFGVRLKGYRSENHVAWSQQTEGLDFQKGNSLVYTDYFTPVAFNESREITVEMAIKPVRQERPSFSFILHLPNPENDWQIVIGQWNDTLVILNNSDYSHKKRLPKIYAPLDMKENSDFVQITSGETGTQVYINGELKGNSEKLFLASQQFDKQIRLIAGNGIHGRNTWTGNYQGLALYSRSLDKEELQSHYRNWQSSQSFGFMHQKEPQLLFLFNEKTGNTVYNKTTRGSDIIIPENIPVLVKNILSWPDIMSNTENMKYDIIINLAGFIPLGFVLCSWFLTFMKKSNKRNLLFCVLTGFLLSLFIEITQVWMPSRDSSLLDLILNTLGTLAGGSLFMFTKQISPHRRKS